MEIKTFLKINALLCTVQQITSLENETEQWDEKIVGGSQASMKDFPYQVSLNMYRFGYYCGGSFISLNHVISAGHCFKLGKKVISPKHILVCAGGEILNSCDISISVSHIYIHEKFTLNPLRNDIGIIKLYKPYQTSPVSRPIGLAKNKTNDGEECIATGWGVVGSSKKSPKILQKVTVKIINHDECVAMLKNRLFVHKNALCAGILEGGKDTCQGDSGGPLKCGGLLVGITSAGVGCGLPNSPGVYVNVNRYFDWIEKILNFAPSMKNFQLHQLLLIQVVLFRYLNNIYFP